MDALEHGLIVEKDSRLAYRVLCDLGVIQGIQQTQSAAMQPAPAEHDNDAGVTKVMAGLVNNAFERARVFRTSLGQMEQDLEQAGGQFDQQTGTIKVTD